MGNSQPADRSPAVAVDTPTADHAASEARACALVLEMRRLFAAGRWGGVLRTADELGEFAPQQVPEALVAAARAEIATVEFDLRYQDARRQLERENWSAAIARLQALVSADGDHRDAAVLLERARAEALRERARATAKVGDRPATRARPRSQAVDPITPDRPFRIRGGAQKTRLPAAAVALLLGILVGTILVPQGTPAAPETGAARAVVPTFSGTTANLREVDPSHVPALLSHVPRDLRTTCSTTDDDLRTAAAKMVCRPATDAGPVHAVNYWIFRSREDFAAAAPRWRRTVAEDSNCTRRAGHAPYAVVTNSGRRATGYLSCMDLGSTAALDWTDDTLLVAATALGADGESISDLRDWWSDHMLE